MDGWHGGNAPAATWNVVGAHSPFLLTPKYATWVAGPAMAAHHVPAFWNRLDPVRVVTSEVAIASLSPSRLEGLVPLWMSNLAMRGHDGGCLEGRALRCLEDGRLPFQTAMEPAQPGVATDCGPRGFLRD